MRRFYENFALFFFDDFEKGKGKAQQNKTRRREKMEARKRRNGARGKTGNPPPATQISAATQRPTRRASGTMGPPHIVAATRRHEAGFTVEKEGKRGEEERKDAATIGILGSR